MFLVFSPWIIVLVICVLASIGAVVGFILMDKKDRVLIDEFIEKSSVEEVDEETASSENATEQTEG